MFTVVDLEWEWEAAHLGVPCVEAHAAFAVGPCAAAAATGAAVASHLVHRVQAHIQSLLLKLEEHLHRVCIQNLIGNLYVSCLINALIFEM